MKKTEERNLPNVFKRMWIVFFLRIQGWGFWKSKFRCKLLRLTGMKVEQSHIGQDVIFDSVHPEDIEIGKNCAITFRCIIITHFVHSKKERIGIPMVKLKSEITCLWELIPLFASL